MVASIRAGEIPLGRLSAQMRIPYAQALVQRAAGVTVAANPRNLQLEVEQAESSIGGEWVIETSALYVSGLLGQTGVRLRAMSSQLLAVDSAADDALRGRDVVRVETSASLAMRYNAATDTFQRAEVSPETSASLRRRASEIEKLIQGCSLHRIEAILPGVGPFDGAWAAPIELAKSKGVSLYSDDVALRRIAQANGVWTFGTEALLRVAAKSDATRMEATEVHAAMRQLMAEFVVDISVDVTDITAQASAEGWAMGAASEVLGRPAWWATHGPSDWQDIAVASGDPSILVPWTKMAFAGALLACRLDDRDSVGIEVVSAGLVAAYLNGGREFRFEIIELVDGSLLGEIADNRLRLFASLTERLDGLVVDPASVAANIVGGAVLL
jgi:hypothetical protein